MTTLTIQLTETDHERLQRIAHHAGKSVQALIQEWIANMPKVEEPFDVTKDPVFQMEGHDSDAPTDLSINLDKYLYGKEYPQ